MNLFTWSLRALFIIVLLLGSQAAWATISVDRIMPASGGSTCDGSFKVIANGSAKPFIVVVLGPTTHYEEGIETDVTFSDLCPGQYQVEVTDRFGCKKTITVTVGVNCRLTLNTPNVVPSCTPNGGAITVTPQGGTAPFTYQWKDQNGIVVSTAATALNLLPGTY